MDLKSIELCPQGFESPRCHSASLKCPVEVRVLGLGFRVKSPCSFLPCFQMVNSSVLQCSNRSFQDHLCHHGIQRAHGVVVSHPFSMREAQGSIPCVSIVFSSDVCATRACDTEAYIYIYRQRGRLSKTPEAREASATT